MVREETRQSRTGIETPCQRHPLLRVYVRTPLLAAVPRHHRRRLERAACFFSELDYKSEDSTSLCTIYLRITTTTSARK